MTKGKFSAEDDIGEEVTSSKGHPLKQAPSTLVPGTPKSNVSNSSLGVSDDEAEPPELEVDTQPVTKIRPQDVTKIVTEEDIKRYLEENIIVSPFIKEISDDQLKIFMRFASEGQLESFIKVASHERLQTFIKNISSDAVLKIFIRNARDEEVKFFAENASAPQLKTFSENASAPQLKTFMQHLTDDRLKTLIQNANFKQERILASIGSREQKILIRKEATSKGLFAKNEGETDGLSKTEITALAYGGDENEIKKFLHTAHPADVSVFLTTEIKGDQLKHFIRHATSQQIERFASDATATQIATICEKTTATELTPIFPHLRTAQIEVFAKVANGEQMRLFLANTDEAARGTFYRNAGDTQVKNFLSQYSGNELDVFIKNAGEKQTEVFAEVADEQQIAVFSKKADEKMVGAFLKAADQRKIEMFTINAGPEQMKYFSALATGDIIKAFAVDPSNEQVKLFLQQADDLNVTRLLKAFPKVTMDVEIKVFLQQADDRDVTRLIEATNNLDDEAQQRMVDCVIDNYIHKKSENPFITQRNIEIFARSANESLIQKFAESKKTRPEDAAMFRTVATEKNKAIFNKVNSPLSPAELKTYRTNLMNAMQNTIVDFKKRNLFGDEKFVKLNEVFRKLVLSEEAPPLETLKDFEQEFLKVTGEKRWGSSFSESKSTSHFKQELQALKAPTPPDQASPESNLDAKSKRGP